MRIKLKSPGNIFKKHLKPAARLMKTAVKLAKAGRSAVDERVKAAVAKELARYRTDGFDGGASAPRNPAIDRRYGLDDFKAS